MYTKMITYACCAVRLQNGSHPGGIGGGGEELEWGHKGLLECQPCSIPIWVLVTEACSVSQNPLYGILRSTFLYVDYMHISCVFVDKTFIKCFYWTDGHTTVQTWSTVLQTQHLGFPTQCVGKNGNPFMDSH